jgi:hypothetical protein
MYCLERSVKKSIEAVVLLPNVQVVVCQMSSITCRADDSITVYYWYSFAGVLLSEWSSRILLYDRTDWSYYY